MPSRRPLSPWLLAQAGSLLLAATAHAQFGQAVEHKKPRPPPPPPPPPPPLIPLEDGPPGCDNASLPDDVRPIFTAFGGSNTQGANAVALNSHGGTQYGRHINSFANLLQRALRGYATKMNADGGSGPSLAGACASRFIPPETRFATIEFLPNIGYIKEDRAELASIKQMLQALDAHGATVYLVNILSGSVRYQRDARFGFCGNFKNATLRDDSVIGCMSRERVVYMHNEMRKIAKAHHAHVITRDADVTPDLFGADSFHLNENGHRDVFNEIWRSHREQPCKEHRVRAARSVAEAGSGILCALGDELEPLVGDVAGFHRTNMAPANKAPKVGWQANAPGASLTLCTTLPHDDLEAKVIDFKNRIMPHPKDRWTRPLAATAPYRISLGFQVSHPRNRPLFGEARVDCFGTCKCGCGKAADEECGIDTLQNTSMVTITTYLNIQASEQGFALPGETQTKCPAESCIIRVRNAADASHERFKVVVRALIFGLNDWRMMAAAAAGRGSLKDVRKRVRS